MNVRTRGPAVEPAARGVAAGERAVRELADVAGRHAERADASGEPAQEAVSGIVAAGFARHFVPERHGGAAGGFAALLGAVAAVGERCASVAWCASLAAGSARLGAYLPESGQADLWGGGPDVLVAAGLIPSGRAVRQRDGWRLTGEWAYTSGAEFSDWVLLCAPTGPGDGAGGNAARFFAVPRAGYTVRPTWRALGMRATASDTVAVTDVFVPEHRSVPRERIYRGEAAQPAARCHAVPLRLVSGLLFAGPALGAATAAVQAWRARLSAEASAAESARLALARSATEVETARLLLNRAAETADRAPLGGPPDEARNARDCAYAVELLREATDRLFRSAGTRVQAAGDPLQRAWRDVSCVAGHVALRFEPAALQYAAHLLTPSPEDRFERESSGAAAGLQARV
ncbi:acyl-CoA dehydrogenase family protein [Nonomuraea jabiensis]|uniref:Two-component flavin-dependent monooxygenase n=1 Tax=Nonomuraea jabiensis TaxID=882448 RepID=A0A7W9GG72_9ACTN|nr:acyl-CoA dehydrogenase family protein [Nonomuraea jabiensis]MBB5783204.1 two-component flavin-dependent monooxygenase [Nonomuraea jabiensis]